VLNAVHDNNLIKLQRLMRFPRINREVDYIALIPFLAYNECLKHIIEKKCYTTHHYQQIAACLDSSPTSYNHRVLLEKMPQLAEFITEDFGPFQSSEIDDCSFHIEFNHVLLKEIDTFEFNYAQDLLHDNFCSAFVESGKLETGEKFLRIRETGVTFVRYGRTWKQVANV
jgi:hypothetical protein